jgi:Ca2+-binding RTX toxin-like protein
MTNTILVTTSVSNVAHGLVMPATFDSAFVTSGITFGSAVGGGAGILALAQAQTITVAGTLVGTSGAHFLGDLASVMVSASGIVQGSSFGLLLDGASSRVQNAGTITGNQAISSDGSVSMLNSGDVTADFDAIDCVGDLTVTNTGLIAAPSRAINLSGLLYLQNMGTILGTIEAAGQDDSVINTGQISAEVILGDGSDLVDTTGGRIFGQVDLGTGDDQYLGGGFAEIVLGGAGRDDLTLAGGDDIYVATQQDGSDEIDAGGGLDTYDGRFVALNQTIDLTTGLARSGGDTDTILGFERIRGGTGRDALTGDGQNNTLRGQDGLDTLTGNAGVDKLYGEVGNDALNGGDGNDRLWGGDGRDNLNGGTGDDVLMGGMDVDVLTGGTGADRFVWTDTLEFVSSGLTGIERITDFQQGQDKIDLSQIDAVPGGADDPYAFVATWTDFNNVAVRTTATQTFVIINATDFIRLDGVFTLTAADFIL